jgi:hypothetical protein
VEGRSLQARIRKLACFLAGFITAERLGSLIEAPFFGPVFSLPMKSVHESIHESLRRHDHEELVGQWSAWCAWHQDASPEVRLGRVQPPSA